MGAGGEVELDFGCALGLSSCRDGVVRLMIITVVTSFRVGKRAPGDLDSRWLLGPCLVTTHPSGGRSEDTCAVVSARARD